MYRNPSNIACQLLLVNILISACPNLVYGQERAKEELARAARAHSGTVSALEATLAAEKGHCQDIRMRLERQTREHQAALAETDQRLLHTQEELDKVRANERRWGGGGERPLQESALATWLAPIGQKICLTRKTHWHIMYLHEAKPDTPQPDR